jgi:hypothetical protein
MAKARLGIITEKWINGKTEKWLDVKTGRPKDTIERTKLTIYISKEAVKSLWHNRAETGEPISHTIEQLVIKHLGKSEKKGIT